MKIQICFLFILKVIREIKLKLGLLGGTYYTRLYLTLMGCNFGKNIKIFGRIYFQLNTPESLSIGDNVVIMSRFQQSGVGLTNFARIECRGKGKICIGNNSGLSSPVLTSFKYIKIGDNVTIGGNVRMFDTDFHPLNYLDRRNPTNKAKSEEIIIEDDVFIGANVIILKGVHVGARSIIGAGSVVSLKNIPQDSLVVGNPARIVKNLK